MKKSMVYKRLFMIYMCIIVALLGIFDMFFIERVKRNIYQNKMYINDKVIYDVNDKVGKMINSTDFISKMMYSDLFVFKDIIYFLNTDLISYFKNKLDKFSESGEHLYRGIEFFTMNSFASNENLENITFISYKNKDARIFNRKNQISSEKIVKSHEFIWLDAYFNKNRISFTRKIIDSNNLEEIGMIVLTYNLDEINRIIKKYNNEHDILILDSKGNLIYDSKDEFEFEKYKYFEEIKNSENFIKIEEKYFLSKKYNNNLLIVSKFKSKNIKVPRQYKNSLITINLVLLSISVGIVTAKLKKLSLRTDNILIAMENVKKGELDVVIPINENDENDELKYISKNFNKMCKELNENIEKSYKAEINQKKAEMIALQNQINPHFLYNTLEGIRMKAICNGDKEVAKMLYNLAFLFRKQVKDKGIISIKDELEYCIKYIEIFKFRYNDKFDFKIEYDENIVEQKIVKFTLQPIIENYFVHGIKLDRKDNKLNISIKKYESNIIIKIKNNGNTITNEKIRELNYSLKNRDYKGESIGISNANERLIIEYGKEYGISFEKNKIEEVIVVVKLPFREGEVYV